MVDLRPRLVAAYQGDEYDAAVYLGDDLQLVTLRSPVPADGFTEDTEGFVKDAELLDCDRLQLVRHIAQYRELPVILLDELGDQVLVESLADDAPAARRAGLDRVERGVYRSWVAEADLRGRRLEHIDLMPTAPDEASSG